MASETHIIGQQDYWPTDEWQTSTPEEQGMNSTYLDQMDEYYSVNNWYLRSLLLIRNGYIVYEDYPMESVEPWTNDTLHTLWGCSEYITMALTGIAIENGNISSVNAPVVEYFTDRTIANLDVRKEAITIEHLLTYTSGMVWDDGDDFSAMYNEPGSVQYILDRPMAEIPGELWNPNSGGLHLLSAILDKTTGVLLSDYAETRIFQPLGIENYTWRIDPEGFPFGTCGLAMKPRDMAKFYLLHINNGTWDGAQLIPEEWVRNSTAAYVTGVEKYGKTGDYGYQWWLNSSYGAYYYTNPWSHYGASVWIFPEYDLIFSLTVSTGYDLEFLVRNFILPSVGVFDFIDPLVTTTTITTTETVQNFDMLVLGLGISGAVAAAVLIVYFYKRRG
ncbi:MAG: serine hydrolase domain-containing protein [Candidatus Thorarchaeota archaeon]